MTYPPIWHERGRRLPGRPREIPAGVHGLTRAAKYFNVDDPVPWIHELSLIDSDTLRRVGEDVWGTADRRSPSDTHLREWADRLVEQMLVEVAGRWTGQAYADFEPYVRTIKRAMEDEAEHFAVVGETLVAVADEFGRPRRPRYRAEQAARVPDQPEQLGSEDR